MESHYFSDPIPCLESFEQHDKNNAIRHPTWTVQVIRIKGDVIVGTLTINQDTFPPRINPKTKKCLWKLPDSTDIAPRFGEHEKKRLWELYKEYKKERRKLKKNDDGDDNEHSESFHSQPAVSTLESFNKSLTAMSLEQPQGRPSSETTTTMNQAMEAPFPPSPPPPPGFGGAATSTFVPPPPPPGIPLPTGTAVSTGASALAASKGVANDDLPLQPKPSPSYFVLPPEPQVSTTTTMSPSMVLGSSVALVFLQTIAAATAPTTSTPGSSSATLPLDTWLSYYSANALKHLLLGRAKAEAHCADMIRQQWESLTQTGSVWECHGWIAQPVVQMPMSMPHSTTTAAVSSLAHQNGTKSHVVPPAATTMAIPLAVMVTLTGKTLQPGMGWLHYTLTLLLWEATTATLNDVHGVGAPPPPTPRDHAYSIVNDVLTLQPLTLAAAVP